jgi:hypothetical protein
MNVRLWRGAVLATVLGLVGAGPVAADIGDNLPPGADAGVWRQYVEEYRAQPDWSPRGTVLVDSGFRSFPDGFSFFNTGVPDAANNAVFGTSLQGPVNLDAEAMRDLIGKRVCVERNDSGPCTLTLAARQWMRSTNEVMAGGHCFGFASTAAELFNRALTPGQFQPGAARTYDLQLREPVSRQIARNMASQYTFDVMQYAASPKRVVSELKASLAAGSMPFTLFIFWDGGGHALTPYALYDRGGGKYDIGVYDNNYPDAARAIRVDTVSDSYRYLVMTSPGGAPEIADDVIGLVPTSVIAARQKCPFCPAANETTVQLTPVRTQVPVRTRITDLDGNRIKGVVVNPPTNPWRPGEKWEFPTYTVPRKQDFIISVENRRNRRPITTSLLATTGQFTIGTEDARIPARGVAVLGLAPDKGLVVYGSNGRRRDLGSLVFVDNSPSSAVQVSARTRSKQDDLLLGLFDEKNKRVVLFTPSGAASSARTSAVLQYADGSGSGTVTADMAAAIPRKGRLVIDYSRWRPARPGGIVAYVQAKGRVTPVRVELG